MSIEIVDKLWQQNRMSDIIPDHGKIMHIYLISKDYETLAHLHPSRTKNDDTFIVKMPPVNFGTYFLYMDVTHATGFSHTMINKIEYKKENTFFTKSIIKSHSTVSLPQVIQIPFKLIFLKDLVSLIALP